MGFKDVIDSAGDFIGKAAETAGRTGKYGKLKASLAANSHKQNELFEEIGKFVMGNEELKAALAQIDASFQGDLEDLLANRVEIQAELDQLKEEGLIPDDDDDADAPIEAEIEVVE